MRRTFLLVAAVAFVLTLSATSARAQDPLESIAVKAKLTDKDRAEISTQVSARASALSEAGADADRRQRARERLLSTPRMKGASKEFLDTYAEFCAKELQSLAGSETFETSFDAVLVLDELNNVKTAEALAAALKAPHAATKLRAARGLQALQKQLAADSGTAKQVLKALGEAGAEETQAPVLRAIYQAVDLGAGAKDEALADECAKALNVILSARVERLKNGGRDDSLDEPAIEAAGRYYPGASLAQQKLLIDNLSKILRHQVNRYFAKDTADGYKPTLSALATKTEDTIREMIKVSKARVPDKIASDSLKKGAKDGQAAKAALDDLQSVLKGEPWNLQ